MAAQHPPPVSQGGYAHHHAAEFGGACGNAASADREADGNSRLQLRTATSYQGELRSAETAFNGVNRWNAGGKDILIDARVSRFAT